MRAVALFGEHGHGPHSQRACVRLRADVCAGRLAAHAAGRTQPLPRHPDRPASHVGPS